MSMMGRFVQVSPDRLKEIIGDPSGVEELLASEQAAEAMPKLRDALGALRGRSPKLLVASMASLPTAIRDRLAQALKTLGIDPDALARGEGGDDLGYGQARYFEASEVAAIACELSRPTLEAEMAARFDPDQMTRLSIYPGKWSVLDRDWVFDAFRQLRQFYMDASAAGLAVATYIE